MINFQHIKSARLANSNEISVWLNNIIKEEGLKTGNITYVFCNDNYLVKKNIQFLNHNTLTDVITFNYCKNNTISGDILISTERVLENSKTYKTKYLLELHRVMAHGLLHLLGYNDKKKNDIKIMREKEDYYLKKLQYYVKHDN